jgi:DNA primase
MLSYISLHMEDWQEHSYVSLCGTAEHAMLWMLEQYPQIDEIALCLDSDEAGIKATERLTNILLEHGHSSIQIDRSAEKDWNDELVCACESESKITMRME